MSGILSFFISCQVIAVIGSSMMALVAVRLRWRALQQAIASIHVRTDGFAAYQQYSIKTTRILTVVSRVGLYVALGMILLLLIFTSILPGFFVSLFGDNDSPLQMMPILAISVLSGYVIGFFLQSLVGTVLIRTRAMNIFLGSDLHPREVLARQVGSLLFILFFIAGFEGILITLTFSPSSYFLVLYLFYLLFVIMIGFLRLFAVPLYLLTGRPQPIEQSQWASLVPRIRDWSKLAGVEFSSVQVQRDAFAHNFGVVEKKRPILLLGETFLRYSNWRQQDAAIALAIAMKLKRFTLFRTVLNVFLVLLATVLLGGLLLLTRSGFTFEAPEWLANVPLWAWNILPWIMLLCIFLFLLVRVRRRRTHRLWLDRDRIAASLTGDPAALVAAIKTSRLLSGQQYPRGQRLEQERIRSLEAFLSQQSKLAPYAMQPVPSIATSGLELPPASELAAVPATPYGRLR